MEPGTTVKHPDYPGKVGHLDRIVFFRGKSYYRVTWPWRSSPGPVIIYAVDGPLEKA